jgi:hypothetical protein
VIKPSRTVMAKTAPYWLATGTLFLLATGTINRMAAPVTFTPATAVPLAFMRLPSPVTIYLYLDSYVTMTDRTNANELKPFV